MVKGCGAPAMRSCGVCPHPRGALAGGGQSSEVEFVVGKSARQIERVNNRGDVVPRLPTLRTEHPTVLVLA